MSSHSEKKESGSVRVELKYCEHCGALWVREGGGGVYCEKCQPKVADLPIVKTKSRRVVLPIRKPAVIDEQEFPPPDDLFDLDAAGGVA
jgi:hypothetical protein